MSNLHREFNSRCPSYKDTSGLAKVAELIEDLLTEMAGDRDMEIGSFMLLAEITLAAASGHQQSSDAMHRARVLDCQRLSAGARKHASQNERLPLRVVVLVLFNEQLKLRDTVEREFHGEEHATMDGGVGEKGEEEKEENRSAYSEEALRNEMERMNKKVVELEKVCRVMRTELQKGEGDSKTKKRKQSMWGEIKRKLGCGSSL